MVSGSVLLAAGPAAAQRAGTLITNTAALSWTEGGVEQRVRSNTNALPVAERLDVTLEAAEPLRQTADLITATLVLTNAGNGEEAFAISAEASPTLGRVRAIQWGDPGKALTGGTTPPLQPGAAVTILVVIDPAGGEATGTIAVDAKAVTGSGTPGTLYPGGGDGGANAVVGRTGADARLVLGPPTLRQAALATLVKRQAVADPSGGSRPVRGAVITYLLNASLPSGTPAATVSDPIPAGTRYLAGSLRVDGAAVTDAGDADGASADDTGIRVLLPAATQPARHIVQFQVVIQ